MAIEEAKRLALNMSEQPQPQRSQEPLAGDVHHYVLAASTEPGDEHHGHVPHDRDAERTTIICPDAGIDAVAHKKWTSDRRRCRHGNETNGGEHGRTLIACQTSRATQHMTGLGRIKAIFSCDAGSAPHQRAPSSSASTAR